MEYLIGIAFNDFVLLASDKVMAHEGIVMKDDENKQFVMGENMVMAVCGEPSHSIHLADILAKKIELENLRNGFGMSLMSRAHMARKILADSLRTRVYSASCLMAGYNELEGSKLFYMDYLGAMGELPYAILGAGGLLTLGILDSDYDSGLSPRNGLMLIRHCVEELKKRFIIRLPTFTVTQIDRRGIKDMPDMSDQD